MTTICCLDLFRCRVPELLWLLMLTPAMLSANEPAFDWQLQRDRDGIQVYTSAMPGSNYDAVMARLQMPGRLAPFVGLVMDHAACPRWVDLCREEREVKRLSVTERVVYTLIDLPFPLEDRDIVSRVQWDYDAESQTVSMNSYAVSEVYPRSKAVRLELAKVRWRFRQLDAHTVQVESFAHVDPNGPIPAWLNNRLLVDSPYKTLQAMRAEISAGKYAKVRPWFE